jgi:hypothetical protein
MLKQNKNGINSPEYRSKLTGKRAVSAVITILLLLSLLNNGG